MITCPNCHATTDQVRVDELESGNLYHCKHCDQSYSVNQDQIESSGVAIIKDSNETHDESPQILEPISTNNEAAFAVELDSPLPVADGSVSLTNTQNSKSVLNKWGMLPEIALIEALGLLIVAWAFTEARAAVGSADIFWWIGLAVIILPAALRLTSSNVQRGERIALVLLLGLALYFVKVMHSPIAFTFPDELSHLRNVQELLQSQHLFQENPIQAVTALYPGLPTVTGTVSSLSGLPIFNTGLVVIGIARLILFLSLYLLFEQVSGSERVAGLATVLYMANPNFLYWTAEYAYEPLALPIFVFVLLMVAKREMAEDARHSRAWTIAAVLGLFTVTITHHMTSYILAGLLGIITVLFIVRSRGKNWGPWHIALTAVFVASMWLIFVANLTVNYLSPVLGGTIKAVFALISQEEVSRELFKSSSAGSQTPLWEQLVAIGSFMLITLGLPFGALEIWRRHRGKVFALLLGGLALAYLPMQMLRFTRAGWETANRSSEFLFIGTGFVLALGIVNFWLPKWSESKSKVLLAGLSVALLFFGGVIAGWPPRARLARPYLIDTGEHLVRPQLVTVAEWMVEYLGPDNRIAASKADAKLLGSYGQHPFTDNGPIKNMFLSEDFGKAEKNTLIKRGIQYVVSDRKVVSWDHMIGYYFYSEQSNRTSDLQLLEANISEKFDGVQGIPRLLDSGDIVIYGVETYLSALTKSAQTASSGQALIAVATPLSDTNAAVGTSAGGGNQAVWSTFIPPGCMRYMVQPSDMQFDETVLLSYIAEGSGQLECLDWSVP